MRILLPTRALLATFVLLGTVVAGPASAQVRDPFIPLIRPAEVTGTTEVGTTTQQPAGFTGGIAETSPGREGLPATGGDVSGWLVLAYVLIAAGLGAAFYGWSSRTASTTRPGPAR